MGTKREVVCWEYRVIAQIIASPFHSKNILISSDKCNQRVYTHV